MPITFGFECEFSGNVRPLLVHLYNQGLIADAGLHSYHCACEACEWDSPYIFRAQRDSSCGGEIISRVFCDDDWNEALDAMEALQEAAMESDAAISSDAGFHVHLGGDVAPQEHATRAWLAAEAAMWASGIATGVFAAQRGGNQRVGTRLAREMSSAAAWYDTSVPGRPPSLLDFLHYFSVQSADWMTGTFRNNIDEILDDASWCDRHSDFVQTEHGGVYEMRVFNATRVAWRMEMACRTAVAMVHPDVASVLGERFEEWMWPDPTGLERNEVADRMVERWNLMHRSWRRRSAMTVSDPMTGEELVEILGNHDERLGELLMKQTGYHRARAADGDLLHTAISNDLDPGSIGHDAILDRINQSAAVLAS